MNRKVLRTIESYHMLGRGEGVLAAVSGGADSVAMLGFLCAGRETFGWRVSACHVNHLLRGGASDADEGYVRELCGNLGVPLHVYREDAALRAARSGQSLETAARAMRYDCFARAAEEEGAKIATAHTLSDSLETALINLARGTGLRGLCGVPPVRGNIVRPLIEVTRGETEAYCRAQGLRYVTDVTNLTDDYTRNDIRHHAVPSLLRANGAAEEAFLRLSLLLRSTQDYLESQADALLDAAAEGQGWRADILAAAPDVLLGEAAALALRRRGAAVSARRVARMVAGVRRAGAPSGSGRWVLECGKGESLVIENGRLFWEGGTPRAQKAAPRAAVPVDAGLVAQFPGRTVRVFCDEYEHYKEIENSQKIPLKNAIDYDKIRNNAVMRTRLPGDTFSLAGRNWTKTLKKLYNEHQIPLLERERRLVLADDAGVLWVEGFGPDRRAAPDKTTARVLTIEITYTAEEAK